MKRNFERLVIGGIAAVLVLWAVNSARSIYLWHKQAATDVEQAQKLADRANKTTIKPPGLDYNQYFGKVATEFRDIRSADKLYPTDFRP